MDYNIPDNNMTSRRGIFAIGVFLSGLLAAWLGFKLGGSHLTKPDMVFGIGCAFLAMGVGMFTLRDGAYPAKAKRNVAVASLAKDRGAVSPVIGVILMVAITVVIAAVVFVLVTGIAGNQPSGTTPDIGFQADDAARTAMVTTSPTNLHWGDFRETCAPSGNAVTLIGPAGDTLTPSPGATPDVQAGDVLSGCSNGDTLTVVYVGPNGVAYEHAFP